MPRALRILIWLLKMLNERPQISEVLDAGWIGLYAHRNDPWPGSPSRPHADPRDCPTTHYHYVNRRSVGVKMRQLSIDYALARQVIAVTLCPRTFDTVFGTYIYSLLGRIHILISVFVPFYHTITCSSSSFFLVAIWRRSGVDNFQMFSNYI
jgi:hypothetical protein